MPENREMFYKLESTSNSNFNTYTAAALKKTGKKTPRSLTGKITKKVKKVTKSMKKLKITRNMPQTDPSPNSNQTNVSFGSS